MRYVYHAVRVIFVFFHHTAATEIYTLSLHDALPIYAFDVGFDGSQPVDSGGIAKGPRSEEHTSELQSHSELVCRLLLEKKKRLPAGAKTRLGPDATGVGWVYKYALEGPGYSPDRLRSIQDFQVRYALQSVSGVAEVASLGGFVRQYQVLLDPARLLAYGVTAREVIAAVRGANQDVGARTVEVAGSD